ncbi:MAG: gamma-glutamyl-gamma-aminobutyrate hydrolase family protein [Solirubrobacterales bacterium]
MRFRPTAASGTQPGLVLQNEAEAPAALLEDWLHARGIGAHTVRVWEQGVPGDPSEFAWVAALGTFHSVTEEDPAWIGAEVDFLRRAVESDVPVLGLCFGAQALSVALGGEISPPPRPRWDGSRSRPRPPTSLPPAPGFTSTTSASRFPPAPPRSPAHPAASAPSPSAPTSESSFTRRSRRRSSTSGSGAMPRAWRSSASTRKRSARRRTGRRPPRPSGRSSSSTRGGRPPLAR